MDGRFQKPEKGAGDTASASALHSNNDGSNDTWYREVIELRKKAGEYKVRLLYTPIYFPFLWTATHLANIISYVRIDRDADDNRVKGRIPAHCDAKLSSDRPLFCYVWDNNKWRSSRYNAQLY